jgi:hypothetical protein
MDPLTFVRAVVVLPMIMLATSACGSNTAKVGAPEPAPVFVGERFPRPQEVVVADTSDTRPFTPRPAFRVPLDIQSRRVEAAFGTIMIIDTTGRVEMPSVTFITDTPRSLQAAVCDVLRKERFSPVMHDQRPRRAALVMPWIIGYFGGQLEKTRMDPTPITNSLRQRGLAAYVAELDTLPHCT